MYVRIHMDKAVNHYHTTVLGEILCQETGTDNSIEASEAIGLYCSK